jgi:hypothetical protein
MILEGRRLNTISSNTAWVVALRARPAGARDGSPRRHGRTSARRLDMARAGAPRPPDFKFLAPCPRALTPGLSVRSRGAWECVRVAPARAGSRRLAMAQALASQTCGPGPRVSTAGRTRRIVAQAASEGMLPAGIQQTSIKNKEFFLRNVLGALFVQTIKQ